MCPPQQIAIKDFWLLGSSSLYSSGSPTAARGNHARASRCRGRRPRDVRLGGGRALGLRSKHDPDTEKRIDIPLAIPVATPLALIEALVPLTPLTPLEPGSAVLDMPLPTPFLFSKAFSRSACRRSSSSLANRSSSSRFRASSASRSRASSSRRWAASLSRIWVSIISSS